MPAFHHCRVQGLGEEDGETAPSTVDLRASLQVQSLVDIGLDLGLTDFPLMVNRHARKLPEPSPKGLPKAPSLALIRSVCELSTPKVTRSLDFPTDRCEVGLTSRSDHP